MSTDLRVIGDRIETLLDQLRATPSQRIGDSAEELVRLVTELYGAGLTRIVELVPDRLDDLIADPLVLNLLLLHGLHPVDLRTRVEDALASVRPLLGHHGGDVELLDIDEQVGAVHLRLLGSCDGCPSSSATLQHAVEKAIVEAAPEIVIIDVEGAVDENAPTEDGAVLISLTKKAQYEDCPSELAST
jgi:Fe-S cluster biogenesis protein NfuA